MPSHTFTLVADDGDSADFNLGSPVNWVDVFIHDGGSAGYDNADFTLEASHDNGAIDVSVGPVFSEAAGGSGPFGYMGTYLVFGNYIKYAVSNADGAAVTATVTIKYRAASMSKAFTKLITADGQADVYNLPRAPEKLHVYANDNGGAGWDGATLSLEASVDGTNWEILPSAVAMTSDATATGITFSNPAKLTRFRVSVAAGAGGAGSITYKLYTLSEVPSWGVKGGSRTAGLTQLRVGTIEGLVDSTTGTPDTAAPIMVEISTGGAAADLDDTENNIATLAYHYNILVAQVNIAFEALEAAGLIPGKAETA